MLKRLGLALLTLLGAATLGTAAQARVDIRVDLGAQTMTVVSASGTYLWPISSARDGYRTPRGRFGIRRMEVMHRSRKYHNSPMPHSLFFTGGYAIHGTYAVGALGSPASHGCIRIAPGNAAALFRMVAQEGGRITIGGTAPVMYARHGYSRTAAKRYRRDDGLGSGYAAGDTYGAPGAALGYAPLLAPGVRTWLDEPNGW